MSNEITTAGSDLHLRHTEATKQMAEVTRGLLNVQRALIADALADDPKGDLVERECAAEDLDDLALELKEIATLVRAA